MLSLGGPDKEKLTISDSPVLLYFCMSTSLVQSDSVTGHLHTETCISELCHCDTRWCVTPCCLVVMAITTVIASRERQHSSTLAFTQQGRNSITQVLFTKCYSSSEAVCCILCLCQSVKIAAELIEQQGCRKSKTLKKGLIDWLKLFCLLPQDKEKI